MPTPTPSARIKICGIRDTKALDAAIDARADYAGFVFYEKSPRHVSLEQAAALSTRAQNRIGRVGLFVNATDTQIAQILNAANLDALQLHGTETPERAGQLRARFGIPVWKALSIACAQDVDRAREYENAVDLILFDAKTPAGTLPGGMGLRFDWSLIAHWKGSVAWGLAGGLSPDNVAAAIRQTSAPLVDTSSGVERAPGIKDADAIASFCQAVRTA